jgi:hypothetical protein
LIALTLVTGAAKPPADPRHRAANQHKSPLVAPLCARLQCSAGEMEQIAPLRPDLFWNACGDRMIR